MNRRMTKARDRRKQHAAIRRKIRRLTDEALKRLTDAMADAISSQGNMVAAMRAGAKALVGFAVETVCSQMVRRLVSDMAPRFHSGGPVGAGLQPGEVPAILSPGRIMTLPPGQIFRRDPGGQRQYLGETGPITVQVMHPKQPPRPPTCGTCGMVISLHPLTGTTCTCAPRQFAWSPLMCTCTANGEQCEYCAAYLAGQA